MSGEDGYMTEEKDENGQPYTKPHLGKSLAERIWDKCDDVTRSMMEGNHRGLGEEYQKGLGRAYATCIQMMMPHYYDTVEDVIKESMYRIRIEQGRKEFRPTPGYKYNPPPPEIAAKYNKANAGEGPRAPRKPTAKRTSPIRRAAPPKLDAGTVANIRMAVESGMMTVEALATAYKMSAEDLRALLE